MKPRIILSYFIFLAIAALGMDYVDNKLMDVIARDYRMMLYSIVLLIDLFVIIMFNVIIHIIKKEKYKSKVSIKDIPEEFEDLYRNLYEKHIRLLEIKRLKIIFEFIILIGVFIWGFVIINKYKIDAESLTGILISVGGAIIFIIAVARIMYNNDKYKKYYKNEIIANFIKLLNDKLLYRHGDLENSQIEKEYRIAKFDSKAFNKMHIDDVISGYVFDDIFIKLYNIDVKYIHDSGDDELVIDKFRGIFSFVKSKTEFNTYIKILKNKIKFIDRNNRTQMDSQEFEKYFDIYSQDKILAMRILTSDTMEYLIDFYKKFNLKFEIVFNNDKIYFRFFTGDIFEPRILRKSMNKKDLFIYYSILKFIIDVTKKVNHTIKDLEI